MNAVINRLSNIYFVYIIFVMLFGLMLGSLLSFYQPFRFENQVGASYSTRELMLVQQVNRKLHEVEKKNDALASEASVLNYQISRRAGSQYRADYLADYRKIADLTGIRPLQGLGLEITVKDSAKPLLAGEDPNTGIVHNTDLLVLVNQLWAAGAKAVSINDQRIVSTSGISCAGPIIIINKTRVSSPFVIHAIGSLSKMRRQLEKPGSYLQYLSVFGIDTSLETKPVEIPAYTG